MILRLVFVLLVYSNQIHCEDKTKDYYDVFVTDELETPPSTEWNPYPWLTEKPKEPDIPFYGYVDEGPGLAEKYIPDVDESNRGEGSESGSDDNSSTHSMLFLSLFVLLIIISVIGLVLFGILYNDKIQSKPEPTIILEAESPRKKKSPKKAMHLKSETVIVH